MIDIKKSQELKEEMLKNISSDWVHFKSWGKDGKKCYFINLKTEERVNSSPLLLEHQATYCRGHCNFCQLLDVINDFKKKHLINNLPEWSITVMGSFRKSDEHSLRTYESIEEYWFSGSQSDSNPHWELERKANEFSASNKEEDQSLKQLFVDEITQNPQDWHIEKEGKLTIVKHKSGRKHYKEGILTDGITLLSNLGKKKWAEIENVLNMEINKPENSLTLLTNDQIEKLNKDKLIDLVKQIKTELERRGTEKSSDNFQEYYQKLETQLNKAESILNSLQNPNISPKPNSVLPIAIGIVVIMGLFGGLIVWKRKKRLKAKTLN